ncbi:hypothetical protein IFM89_024323 [Coptis chinensis]|uniref:Uncharacterized protein n=1 Tax=Coptis chinensis TaxID=261450 RepID=A0A835IUV1_9MAGN|nr:hypothetical protein IFM89_024323 [Coptis chinensis]
MTLDRLERDVARVNFLNNKIYQAINGNRTTDLKPMDFEIPVTSGRSQRSGEYFARFGFGTPPKQLILVATLLGYNAHPVLGVTRKLIRYLIHPCQVHINHSRVTHNNVLNLSHPVVSYVLIHVLTRLIMETIP